MKIYDNRIYRDYNKLKKQVDKCYNRKKYNSACMYLQKAAMLMYNSNLIYRDEHLEDKLGEISKRVLDKPILSKLFNNSIKRIVFYDYFMLDNRGLTEQYLNALIASNYKILFIGFPKSNKSKEIIKKLNEKKIKTLFISNGNEVEKAKTIFNAILDFAPESVIYHTSPWDVPGLIAINRFDGILKRYLINITDHAFWLGTKSFDYYFEFRDYGYNISKDYRKINEDKLLKLPYYPIVNKNMQFQGFDFDTNGKKIIFSGGSVYKIQGSPVFLNLVKSVLNKHPDCIFLFLANGDLSYVKDFAKTNNLEKRVFCYPERKDIYEVFKRCYLYLNTYPLIGGLMTQYACVAGKLPLTLNDTNDPCNNIYELMMNDEIELQFNDYKNILERIDLYINNPAIMLETEKRIKKSIINTDEFNHLFRCYLDNPKNSLTFKSYEIDIQKFSEQYVERFNENKENYYSLFIARDLSTLHVFGVYYIKYAIFHLSKIIKDLTKYR